MALVAPPPSWASRDPGRPGAAGGGGGGGPLQVGPPPMPPAHLTPSATPEDITCLVPAGSVLTSRDPLPPSTTPGSQANSSQSGSSQRTSRRISSASSAGTRAAASITDNLPAK
ncbi:homeobox protein Hox-D9-like, partial [Nylanderia fulva]|uniref:homeobox protein Hox-D9-like n=1 Tax=Nylanderia fulva TaxID=613905 RepID=UPI0010FBA769